jgi:hypothetical protein
LEVLPLPAIYWAMAGHLLANGFYLLVNNSGTIGEWILFLLFGMLLKLAIFEYV